MVGKKKIINILYGLNTLFHHCLLGDVGYPCKISPFALFGGCRKRIKIGAGTIAFSKAYFHCDREGSITIGKYCEIHSYARIMTYGGKIQIGDYCSVNPYSILYGIGGLNIGSMVRIAAHVVIIPANHGIYEIDVPIMQQDIEYLPIRINDNVWIGAGAKILGGVTIGSGAVIGAGAVITKNVPENGIAVGVPAKVIAIRGKK